ncbi:hypothetical protein F5Y17DRAFT_458914 [Xylariaceae sp. FL0594]|nr:hypothetical protein F5Y17DRAFT_458914 [Xylariaceae sp. FL0594]
MGKPDISQDREPHARAESSQHPYVDDYDDAPDFPTDDLPPSYDDIPHDHSSSSPSVPLLGSSNTGSPNALGSIKSGFQPIDADAVVYRTSSYNVESWVARSVEDPEQLEKYVRQLATIPPGPQIFIHGSHTETSKDAKGKDREETVTDFAIYLDLKPYLFVGAKRFATDGQGQQEQPQSARSWTSLRTVENSERTYRGTRFRKRGPRSPTEDNVLEAGVDPYENKPTLREWCHRFGASHAGLKCFTLRREVLGFDDELFTSRIHHLIRQGLNYRGTLRVEMVVKKGEVHLLNACAVNRWRFTKWIRWFFYLTFLWLLAWPYLWLRTKKWGVVIAEWSFSRINPMSGQKEFVSFSEDQLFDLWEQPIAKAVLQGERGATLKHDELVMARRLEATGWRDPGRDIPSFYLPGLGAGTRFAYRLGWGENC